MPMELNFEELLSPKIKISCLPLWQDGHYKQAAHESMIQVEQALKEKGLVQTNYKEFGQRLITNLFRFGGTEKSIKLRVPLGDELQEKAELFFTGVFTYYRNYTAHDGSKIDKHTSIRIMILASELLDLIDASSLSFSQVGGVDGLVKIGPFPNNQALLNLLQSLEGIYLPDGEIDGLLEDLIENYGLTEIHIDAAIELDLVRYSEIEYFPTLEELRVLDFSPPQFIGCFELTELGQKTIDEIRKIDKY